MTEVIRALILKVHAGDPQNLPTLHLLYGHRHCESMLRYLIRKDLIGRRFTEWFNEKCKAEPIRLFAVLSKEILLVNTAPKIIKGENFQ